MLIGYARTSTNDQTYGLDAQLEALEGLGCERVYREQVSSVDRDSRLQLKALLDFVREGDVVAVTKLDRLARSVGHLVEITGTMEGNGVALRVLDMGLDTGTSTGRLMLHLLGSIAQFEREGMIERQREGIARAKAAGKYRGRTRIVDAKAVRALKAEGLGASAIAKQLRIGRASVSCALA